MIHTYRDPSVLEDFGLFRYALLPPFVVFGILAVASGHVVAAFAAGAALLGLSGVWESKWFDCGEIRLGDDGTCELETKRRLIRLHVNEIRSVKYVSDEGEEYTIRYRGGKLDVTSGMADFSDFLARLKTMNPAVDLSSFPADWTGSGRREGATGTRAFVGRALFPLGMIGLLVFLAGRLLLWG